MKNADYPRAHAEEEQLLRLDPRTGRYGTGTLADLPDQLRRFDLLVMNDAATLPASLPLRLEDDPRELELRLAGQGGDALTWWAVLFGPGNWHVPTERRPAPPRAMAGDTLWVGPVSASVLEVSPISPRLVRIRFHQDPEHLYRELYRLGRPVQYSYVRQELELWDVQTRYGARPWALEMPSAGRPLTWDILARARAKGVGLASLTHAAGLSATGDPALDAALPLPERYELPQRTVDAINFTRDQGGRAIAVGTSVVRALEGNAIANEGHLRAGSGTVSLVLGPEHDLSIVDGLLTGIHEPGTSHFALMEAFVPRELLEPALHYADGQGFLQHEFGDSMLIMPERSTRSGASTTCGARFKASGFTEPSLVSKRVNRTPSPHRLTSP
jgi:S-adenosylmethionine:tRNA ribosyltransferase-isomerase